MIKLGESGENYLETIIEIEKETGVVRSAEIAKRLKVSRPSVNKAIGILKEAGMVEQEYYGTIQLTEMGRERANNILSRHVELAKFFTEVLKIDDDTANTDACRVEHVVCEKTMAALSAYIKKLGK